MNPAYLVITFAVVFGMVMGAIGLGYRMLEAQRKKQVEGMLNAVSGEGTDESQPTILMDQPEIDAVESVLDKGLYGRTLKLLQQSGVPWTVSRLVFSMLIGAIAGGLLG